MRRGYATLDGMRGLAAALIVVRHSQSFFGLSRLGESFLAVDLFFVLSGFVLAHAYGQRLDRDLSAARFMLLRWIRLTPLNVLGLALGVAVVGATVKSGAGWLGLATAAVCGLFFILPPPATLGGQPVPIVNAPAWSLFFELAANLVMALAWRRLGNRALGAICAISALVLTASVLGLGTADAGYEWATAYVGAARVGFSFFAGILIYRFRDRTPFAIPPWVVLAIEGLVLAYIPPDGLRAGYDLAWILVGFPLLVAGAVQREPAFGASTFRFLGLTSYAIYILHFPLRRFIQFPLHHFGEDDWMARRAPLSGLAFLGLVFLASWAADRFYDALARAWLARATRRRDDGVASAAPAPAPTERAL